MAEQEQETTAGHDHEHDHGDHDHDHAKGEGEGTHGEQKVTIEDVGPARKCLTIEVPPNASPKKSSRASPSSRRMRRFPVFAAAGADGLLQRRFGDSIREDVRGQLLSETYSQAIEDEKLEVIGEPDIKDLDAIKLPDTGPMVYKVEVEVSPKVELPSLEGIPVNKPKAEVTEEDITKEVETARERQGKLVAAPEGAATQAKDFVLADVNLMEGENAPEGAPEISRHPGGYIMVPGEADNFRGPVLGIMVDDLGHLILGKKPGDNIDISTKGPPVHEEEKIRDKPITIKIHIEKIERLEPASMETLLQQLGVKTDAELRERVKQVLTTRNDRQRQGAMHEQVCNHLMEKVDLTLPEGLTGRQTARILRRQAMEMAYAGSSEQEIEQRIAEQRSRSEEDARKQLKLFFILDKASKDLSIDVSEGEVNQRIYMLAMQQGRRPEKLRQHLARTGEIEQIFLQIREQKTLDKILEKAQVTEVDQLPAAEPEEKAKA